MYKSVAYWRDLEDGHLYNAGDAFPHDGREVSQERIAELLGTQNKAGFALIEAVHVPDEEIPIQKAKTPRKGTRSPKKAG